jgi:ATP-dependent Lon protease
MSDVTSDSGTVPNQNHPAIPEDTTIILPVRNMLLFPGMVLPLTIGRPASIAAAQEAVRSGRKIGLLLQNDPAIEQPGPEHLRRVGTLAEVLRYVTSEGTHYIISRGLRRFRVEEFLSGFPFLVARIKEIGISESSHAGGRGADEPAQGARPRCAPIAAEPAAGDRGSHR